MTSFRIGSRWVGAAYPAFIIAEIGSNHDQDLDKARRLIAAAAECGADAVKFQSLDYDRMHAYEDSDMRALFERIRLDEAWYEPLSTCAAEHGVAFSSSPCYLEAVSILDQVKSAYFKIASPQTKAFPQVIAAAARTGKPLIISTGYCDLDDVARAVAVCREAGGRDFVLLQCTARYPAPPEALNLRAMRSLEQAFECPVGFSDHSLGTHIAASAVAMGACVIEKHITLDRTAKGPDHAFALEPPEFRTMVQQIRETEAALGNGRKIPLEEEVEAFRRYRLGYRLVASRDLGPGQPILGHLAYKRADTGILAVDEPRCEGLILKRQVRRGDLVDWSDVECTE